MSRSRIVAVASAGMLGLTMIAGPASAQTNGDITIDPTSGPPGQVITVSGGDCFPFGPPDDGGPILPGDLGTLVDDALNILQEDDAFVVQLEVVHAVNPDIQVGSNTIPTEHLGEDGSWSGTVTVAESAQPDDYFVRASCANGGFTVIGSAAFTVLGPGDPPDDGDDPPGDPGDPDDPGLGGPGDPPDSAPPGDPDSPAQGEEGDTESEDDDAEVLPAPPAPAVNGHPEQTG